MIGYCCIGQYFPLHHTSYRHSRCGVAHEDTSRYCRGICFTCVYLTLPWHAGCCVGPAYSHVLSRNSRILVLIRYSLTVLNRRHTRRSNSFSRQRRHRIYCSWYRHRQLDLLGHRTFRNEAIPTIREIRLDPSAPGPVRTDWLCWAAIRHHLRLDWKPSHCGGKQAFFPITLSLCAELMVGSCVGLLCLLPGDNLADQDCFIDRCWPMAVIQSGIHDRVLCSDLWTGY